MNTTLLKFVPVLAVLASCGGKDSNNDPLAPRFEYSGLTGHIVSQITAYDNEAPLLVATDKGLYISDNGGEWERSSPISWRVNSIENASSSHILASVTIDGEHKLMESLNGGQDWDEVDSDFGIVDESASQEQIRNMLYDQDSDVLYGVGLGVLAQSNDIGREWAVVDGDWQSFATGLSALERHPDTGDFWIGGQGAIENPVLRQVSSVDNEAVDHSQEVMELLEAPSVVKAIRFFDNDENRVLVSGEGGIIQSLDYGQTWQALHVNHNSRFYFDVIVDPDNSDILYTAGWDKNFDDPQELRLEVSRDGGKTWKIYKHKDPALRGGVWSMKLRTESNKKVIYLGLCNGGVFRATVR